MSNDGSPNPSVLVVNLLEDARQADYKKLHVTTHPFDGDGGLASYYGSATADASAAVPLVTRTVPTGKLFHVTRWIATGDANARFRLKVNGVVVTPARNSAAEPTVNVSFEPELKVSAGSVVTIEATNLAPRPIFFEAALLGFDETVT